MAAPASLADLAALGWTNPAAVNAPAQAPPPAAIPPPTPNGLAAPGAPPPNNWVTDPKAWATPEKPAAPPGPPPKGVPFAGPPGPAPQTPPPPTLPPGMDPNLALALARQGTGGPAVVRPEHWSPTTRQTQVTHGIPLSEKTEKAFTDYQKAQQEGAKAGTELAMAQLAEDARQKSYVANIDAANLKYQDELRQWQTDRLNEQRSHIDGLMKEANSQDIDTGKWFNDKNDFGKLMTGLSMIARGFNFGLTGRGPDPATWVNQQIAQNVAAQQAKFNQSRAKVSDAVNLYGLMRDRFGDDEKAAQATALAQRQNLIAKLQADAANKQLPDEQRIRAAGIAEKLSGQQFEDRRKLEESIADHVVTHGAEQFHERQVVGGGPQDILKVLERANKIKGLIDSLNGADPATVKERSALTKEWAETQVLLGKLSGAGATGKEQNDLAKQLEKASVPTFEENLRQARTLIEHGVPGAGFVAGTVIPERAVRAAGNAVHEGLGENLVSSDARRLDAVAGSLAEAVAHANGQRGLEAIQFNKRMIMGNGSAEDVRRGIDWAEHSVKARKAAIEAGASPAAVAGYHARLQGAGTEAPPGFEPGIANEKPEPAEDDE